MINKNNRFFTGKTMENAGRVLFLGILVVGFFFLIRPKGMTEVGDEPGKFKLGVVNIQKVYKNYDRAKAFSDNMKIKKEKIEKKIKKLSQDIKRINKELKSLEPMSDDWKKLLEQYSQIRAQRDLLQKLWKKDVKLSLNETTAKIYNSIREAVDGYGKKHDYDLILKTKSPRLETDNPKKIDEKIKERSVLYFRNKTDLTDTITKLLNDRYNKKNDNK